MVTIPTIMPTTMMTHKTSLYKAPWLINQMGQEGMKRMQVCKIEQLDTLLRECAACGDRHSRIKYTAFFFQQYLLICIFHDIQIIIYIHNI